jgi:hypothetical protein
MQPWPTLIKARANWSQIYDAQKKDLKVLDSVDEAIAWANELIAKIDAAE